VVPGLNNIISFGASLAKNFMALRCAAEACRLYQGGNQWSAWSAYISFFRHVAKLDLDYSKWDCWEQLTLHSGWRFVHPEFCIICDRPEVLLVDEQNRPHCDTGPFCRWRDGSAVYSVHGVRVPADVIEDRSSITVARIQAETNAEVRRVMIDRYGPSRYATDSGAKEIQRDDYGRLLRTEVPGDEPIVLVEVVNSTAEPDGSFKNYQLRVPPGTKTAREGVAWSFGKTEAEYEPLVET
jgi:hypothetical protein